MEQNGTFVFTLWSQLTFVWRSFADKNMIDRLAALNTWESFSCLLISVKLLLYWKTEIRYFTLPFIVHFDTYSTQSAVHTIDTMSIYMKFGVENPCLYEMVAVLTLSFFPACFLIKIKRYKCLCHNSSFMDWGIFCHSFHGTAWTLAITVRTNWTFAWWSYS